MLTVDVYLFAFDTQARSDSTRTASLVPCLMRYARSEMTTSLKSLKETVRRSCARAARSVTVIRRRSYYLGSASPKFCRAKVCEDASKETVKSSYYEHAVVWKEGQKLHCAPFGKSGKVYFWVLLRRATTMLHDLRVLSTFKKLYNFFARFGIAYCAL